jgi:hypothetical protein
MIEEPLADLPLPLWERVGERGVFASGATIFAG